MRFCGLCGTRLTCTCAECGFANPLHYRFCGMCGVQLFAQTEQPATIDQNILQPQAETASLFPAASPPLEGEHRVVTVLLTDLTDSTKLLEKVGTEGWVELMNRILHILESEISRFGGEVSQFRGDGLVAFFGATSANEDDPERAVLAALSMQRALTRYLQEFAPTERLDLRMRVGVDTGEVIVTGGHGRQQWQETAMGMAVMVAARMETAAEPGTVLVSEHTYRLVESQFDWQVLGEIFVKGVSQPIAVYRPHARNLDPNRLQNGHGLPNSIQRIGRDAEFHSIKNCVEGLFEGRGRIVTLTGAKGSGKTSLLNEVRQYFTHYEALIAETPAVSHPQAASLTWASVRCRSYSQTWPYSLWKELFRNWLGMRPNESKEDMLACLRNRAQVLWGVNLDEHYPYIATSLGLPLEEAYAEKIRHLDGEGLRQRFFLAVRSWIELSSQSGPLVLVISDMQWADDSSLAILKYCLPICDNEPLLLLFSFRSERDASIWDFYHYLEIEYPHRLTSVDLQPLTEAQSQELINHLIGPETLSQDTRSLIIHSAGGNPYYILELIRTLIAEGVLIREEESGSWLVTRTVTTLDLPDSLQLLLMAGFDRLSAQERLVLQVSAVIGSVFWLNMLQTILGEPPTLKADLAALQRNQFIQESGRVPELGMQYAIKSPLMRDTAYESLLSSQRAAYHLKAAEYLESLSAPDIPGGYDGMLAYHYRGAGNPKKELFYTLLAADQSRKIYANFEALQHYTRSLELLDVLEEKEQSEDQSRFLWTQRFEILNDRRKVLYQLGQIEASRADTQALLPLARQMSDDPIWLIDALLAQADIATDSLEELTQGLQMAQQALSLARQIGDSHREMRSLIRVSSNLFGLKDPAWRELAERALELARQLGDLKTEVNLLLGIGGSYGMDDLPRSREYLQVALSRSETLNDKATELPLLEAIGQQFERDGDYYRQLTEYELKRLRISREIGNRLEEGNALMFCGQIQALYLGDYDIGLELVKQALVVWENITARLFPLLRIAQIQALQGRYNEALATLEMARPLSEKAVTDTGLAGLNLVTVIIYNMLGDEQSLRSALEIASQIQQMVANNLVSRQYHMTAASEASAAHLNLAHLIAGREADEAEIQAHVQRALESSQSALHLYQEFGFVQVVECTSEEIFYRHSQALTANHRDAEAAEFLKRAYDEMIRKHDLIPVDSPFRKTYLENIQLHRDIQAGYLAQIPT